MPSFPAWWTILTASCLVFPKRLLVRRCPLGMLLLPEFKREPRELRTLHLLLNLYTGFLLLIEVLLLVYKSLSSSGQNIFLISDKNINSAYRSLGSSQLVEPRVTIKQGEAAFSCCTQMEQTS